jgi:AraC-like DNA-binding protein
MVTSRMTEILPNARSTQTEVASIELSCGRFDALRARHFVQRFPPHFHDTFAIGVVESGSTRLLTHRGEWVARAGSILAFSPGEVHGAEALGSQGYTYRMVYPSRALMHEIAAWPEGGDDRTPLFRTPVIEDRDLATQLRKAHVPLMAGDWRTTAESQLIEGLRSLAKRHGALREQVDSVRPLDLEVAEKARALLQERFAQQVRLSVVADECGMTLFHLIRVFRRVMGVPPYAYLVQLRVNRAQAMLHAGSSIADVAYACGFCDQSHLNRMFKKAVGVPPGQYVRQVRQRTAA